eukprot:g9204.t1
MTKRVISNHGTAQVKRKQKQDMRKSFAKARLDVRLQKRKSMGGPPVLPPKANKAGSTSDGDNSEKPKSRRKQGKSKSKRKASKHSPSKSLKLVPWPTGWSNLGVSMRFLHNMFSRIEPHTTTRQLVEYIVLQETGASVGQNAPSDVQHGGSYVEYLKLNNQLDFHGNSVVGVATHYVSHAWDATFVELISALDVLITTQHLNPATTFFWIDIFSLSQHMAHQNQLDENDDVEVKTRDAIKNLDCFVLVIGSWNSPFALSRTWCLWELLCALSAKRQIEVCMPGKSLHDLHDALLNVFPAVASSLTTIDYKNSKASKISVHQKIMIAIDNVGERRATRAMEKALRNWLVSTSRQVLQDLLHNN